MPVTVTVYVPAVTPEGAVMVRVEVVEPEIWFGLGTAVHAPVVDGVAVKLTASVKPFSEFRLMVVVAVFEVAVFIVTALGEAEMLKSGMGGAPK